VGPDIRYAISAADSACVRGVASCQPCSSQWAIAVFQLTATVRKEYMYVNAGGGEAVGGGDGGDGGSIKTRIEEASSFWKVPVPALCMPGPAVNCQPPWPPCW